MPQPPREDVTRALDRRMVIGTRGSKLALWQANYIADELRRLRPGVEVELQIIKTQGDKITDVALAQIGGKGLFTKEIEAALLSGTVDLAVHSLKDLPTELPEGLCIGAFPLREDPRDALVSLDGVTLEELPQGAIIGTSSLRRQAQLQAARPDLRFVDLRGNVETRIRKIGEQNLNATVLAMAGLNRLEIAEVGIQPLSPDVCLPAVGQGILGLEARSDDTATLELLSVLDDPAARACATAERACLAALGGGCQVPVGALAELTPDGKLRLRVIVSSCDGATVVRADALGEAEYATAMAQEIARDLLRQGAGGLLFDCGVTPPAGS